MSIMTMVCLILIFIHNSDINDNSKLNMSFSEDDVLQVIKSLKNHKNSGNDLILNEF